MVGTMKLRMVRKVGETAVSTLSDLYGTLNEDDQKLIDSMMKHMEFIFVGRPLHDRLKIKAVRLGTAIVEVVTRGEFKVTKVTLDMSTRGMVFYLEKVPKVRLTVSKVD